MSRILKRPMFRKGGSPNKGIMTGLVDRTKHAETPFVTGVGQKAGPLISDIRNLVAMNTPKPKLNYGGFGIKIASGVPILEALGQGYDEFRKKDDSRTSGIDKTALSLGLTQAMKDPKDSRTSLMKNLEAAGFVKGTPEYEKALRLRTLPTGTVGFSDFQTKANVDKSLIAGNYASESIDFLTSIAELGARSPESFGLKGKLLGFSKDVATEVEGLHDSSLRSAAENFGISAGGYDFIKNPDFSKIQPLENALSIRLARTRNPRDRLMKDMIRDAKDDTSLSGLGGATKVKDRLPTIFQEFLDTATNRFKAAGKKDEEIAAILNPKIIKFNEAMAKLSGIKDTKTDQNFTPLKKGKDGIFRF